jgi:adenylate cyclase
MGEPSTRRTRVRRETRLQVSISTIFALLILPALGVVIAFSYYENAHNLTDLSRRFVDRTRDDAVEMSKNLIEPVGGTLRLVARAEEATPGFFRSDESANFLYEALVSAPQIDAVYASFENGYHRVVTRIDDDRRRSDPRIPANANWHMSFIDDFTAGSDSGCRLRCADVGSAVSVGAPEHGACCFRPVHKSRHRLPGHCSGSADRD